VITINNVLNKRTITYTNKEYKIIAHKDGLVPLQNRKRVKTTISYKKGGVNQLNKLEYEYDDSGERTKSALYGK